MSEKLKESLSAVIDGEADEFELRRVLDEIGKDRELAASWERYHVIGATLRGERTLVGAGMRERIWAELEVEAGEPALAEIASPDGGTIPVSTAGKRRWAPLAVAATVALAVVVGFAGFDELGGESAPVLAASPAAETAPDVTNGSSNNPTVLAEQQSLYQAVALREEVSDADQNRTDAYIVRHYQQIGMDQPGIGFTRMVAYERD